MTHTSTEQPELLPCPFCGGNAHFEIDMDSRWEWVECESCGMQGNSSASLMEDCKPKLREAWNRRTPASQAQRPPLDYHEIAMAHQHIGSYGQLEATERIVRWTERRLGITQEKQG